FSDEFHETLAHYNQKINTIKSLESWRRNLCASSIELSNIVQSKVQLELNQVLPDYNKFIGSFNPSNQLENDALYLANSIFRHNENIHYNIIGSRDSGGLKTCYHIIQEEIERQEKNIEKKKIFFNIILFLISILSLLALYSFLGLTFNNFEQIFILLLVSIIFVLLLESTMARPH
ncbi:MAG: hypothetical protein WC297_03615, partial [Candidatus Paceibacterota bacterium]